MFCDDASEAFPSVLLSRPYTAKLLGWSDEEIASRDFLRLVDAIRWIAAAEQNGALAKCAQICSPHNELLWARPLDPIAEQRSRRLRAMNHNANRILVSASV